MKVVELDISLGLDCLVAVDMKRPSPPIATLNGVGSWSWRLEVGGGWRWRWRWSDRGC